MKGTNDWMKKKIKVYLDTSVISYLDQQDAPEKMKETQEAWEVLKSNEYEIVVSSIALSEIQECNEEKYQILIDYYRKHNQITF